MEKNMTNLDKGREGGGQKSWKFCGHLVYMAPNKNRVHCVRNNLRTCLETQIQRVNYFLGNSPIKIICMIKEQQAQNVHVSKILSNFQFNHIYFAILFLKTWHHHKLFQNKSK